MGLLGSAVLGDKVTELLDVRAAILAADPAFYSAHPTALAPAPTVPERTPTSLLEA
jgi:two-component system chemotaxis sensor kinase CheA